MALSLPLPSAVCWRQAPVNSKLHSLPTSTSTSMPLFRGSRSVPGWSWMVQASSSTPLEGSDYQRQSPQGVTKKGFGSSSDGPKKKADAGGKKKEGSGRSGVDQKGVMVGRGTNASPKKQGTPSRLNKVVDVVDKKSSASSSIDPAQAGLGKVDFVRVQNWGSEGDDAPQLEDLKIKSFSPAASSAQNSINQPFYEKLVNRLQLLESKGEMAVAQAAPLPSFDRWAFGEDRYLQFLVDQRSVFEALRDVITAVRNERCQTAGDTLEEVVPLGGAAAALGLFGVELGLDRCEGLNADIKSITERSNVGQKHELEDLKAQTQAVGYAKYLRQLGNTSLTDIHHQAKTACLKLLAHSFAVYVSHLTTGMRIGAKALDNIASLRQSKALRFYRDYPLQSDPLKLFIANINAAGSCISLEDDQEQVMEELPKAFQRTSLLLSVLAVEEPQVVGQERST